jgi:hypothetical protein
MEQSPSWEANRFSASQEILHILWNPKVHYRIAWWDICLVEPLVSICLPQDFSTRSHSELVELNSELVALNSELVELKSEQVELN